MFENFEHFSTFSLYNAEPRFEYSVTPDQLAPIPKKPADQEPCCFPLLVKKLYYPD